MTTELFALDLATINAVQNSIVSVLRNQCCQWEQDSADAIAENKLSTALTLEQWAFASDLLSRVVATECSALFSQVLDARINWRSRRRADHCSLPDCFAGWGIWCVDQCQL